MFYAEVWKPGLHASIWDHSEGLSQFPNSVYTSCSLCCDSIRAQPAPCWILLPSLYHWSSFPKYKYVSCMKMSFSIYVLWNLISVTCPWWNPPLGVTICLGLMIFLGCGTLPAWTGRVPSKPLWFFIVSLWHICSDLENSIHSGGKAIIDILLLCTLRIFTTGWSVRTLLVVSYSASGDQISLTLFIINSSVYCPLPDLKLESGDSFLSSHFRPCHCTLSFLFLPLMSF